MASSRRDKALQQLHSGTVSSLARISTDAPYTLSDLLGAMDMALDESACPGLVQADEKTLTAKKLSNAPLEEIVALERARHFKADYVYFRRLAERPAMATAYLYDRTERLADANENLAELHRGFWSACEIPLVYVFLPTQVQIYHILQGPRERRRAIEENPWKVIEIAAAAAEDLRTLKAFSARKLDDGTLWEDNPDAALKLKGAAFMALSEEIGDCRAELVDKHGVDEGLVRRLLILFVMIKYLEERKDRNGQGVFPEGTFARFAVDARGFVDLLRAGATATLAFLDHLAEKDRFNGEVFELDLDERKALLATDLSPLADLLDARVERGQRTFWRRYAFHELPVELISHLYEQFLPRQPGVVYTPPFLVNFILDEVLPLSQRTPETFRLLDPACGSGVFLVGAFKRIVHRWRRDHDFRAPDVETLQRLLRQHIFGIDLEGEAIRLTLFSLSVALCDFLEPRVIWDELHFDHLQENLRKGDFFAHFRQGYWDDTSGFDLIVGNPPFISKLTSAADSEVADLKQSEPGFDLPDNQEALLFLKTATRIARRNASIALIQPSGPLLYGENSSRFRSAFLEQFHVSQIVDLTHLSRILFKRQWTRAGAEGANRNPRNPADVAIVVIFAENRPPTDEPLLHVTVRRTVQAEQKIMFEIDHYDLHFVPRSEALNNAHIWKANFIGGGRIPNLVQRLGKLRSLQAFLDTAAQQRGWVKGEGYIAGDESKAKRLEILTSKESNHDLSASEAVELKNLRKRYRKASWLTGRFMLPTKAFTAKGIDRSQMCQIRERFFAEPRSEHLFSGPLLLIKEVVEAETEKLPTALLKEGIRFKHQIFGIHAPESDMVDLERIHSMLNNHKLVHFHLLATSSRYLINKSSALGAADILRLPFPDSAADLDLSPLEEVLVEETLNHVAEFKRKGKDARIQQPPNQAELAQFGDFFCQVLGSVYRSLQAAEPIQFGLGICYPFYFGDAPSERFEPGDAGALKLSNLLTLTMSQSLRCQRILRVFHGNMLLLVKPAQLRYWLRSIAVRDADEMFVELQEQGH